MDMNGFLHHLLQSTIMQSSPSCLPRCPSSRPLPLPISHNGTLPQFLHHLQVTDLHGGLGVQQLGTLPHQSSRLHVRLATYYRGLTQPLLTSRSSEPLLRLHGNDYLVHEHVVHIDPRRNASNHQVSGFIGDLETLYQQLFEVVLADHLPQAGNCQFDKSSVQVHAEHIV